MNRFANVLNNLIVLGFGNVVNKVAGALVFIVLARYIGADGIGQYAFANSFTMIFIMVSDLGLNMILVRSVTQDPSLTKKYLGNVIIIRSVLAVLAFIIVAVIILSGFIDQSKTPLFWLCAIAVFIISLSLSFRWSFQAFKLFHIESTLLAGESIAMLCFGCLVLYLGYGILEFTGARIVASLIICVVGFFLVRKYVAYPDFVFDPALCKDLISRSMPIMGTIVCSTLYFNMDTILLGFLTDDAETGRYNAAYRVILFLRIVPGLFQTVTYPVIIEARSGPAEEFLRITERSYRYIIIVGLGIIGVTISIPEMILKIYGNNFGEAASLLSVLIFASFFYLVANFSYNILLSDHKEGIILKASIVSLVVNIILNVILIPSNGALGASIAIFTSEAVGLILLLHAVNRCIKSIHFGKLFLKPLFAISIAFIATFSLKEENPVVCIISLMMIYCLMMLITRVITISDLKLGWTSIKGRLT